MCISISCVLVLHVNKCCLCVYCMCVNIACVLHMNVCAACVCMLHASVFAYVTCIGVSRYVRACVSIWRPELDIVCLLQLLYLLLPWDRVHSWTGNSPFQLSWLVSRPVLVPSTELIGPAFVSVLRIRTHVCMLIEQVLFPLSHLSSLADLDVKK